MFIGHYSVAFAAKAVKPRLPLWHLFVAVQLIDFVWAVLVMAGIEKVRFTPGLMEASMLDLYYMPYTHSLPGALFWSIGAGSLYALVRRKPGRVMAGCIIAAAVFSHWIEDLIVHRPDLALYPGGPKLGFSLWDSFPISQAVEIGTLIIGAVIYMLVTKAKGMPGRIAPVLLLAAMIGLQFYSHLPVEVPPTPMMFGITALFGYTLLAFLAWLTDRTRTD